MEEFHDDLDDDIVGSRFVRGSGELMVLFEDLMPLFCSSQLSARILSLSIPVDYLLNVFHILLVLG